MSSRGRGASAGGSGDQSSSTRGSGARGGRGGRRPGTRAATRERERGDDGGASDDASGDESSGEQVNAPTVPPSSPLSKPDPSPTQTPSQDDRTRSPMPAPQNSDEGSQVSEPRSRTQQVSQGATTSGTEFLTRAQRKLADESGRLQLEDVPAPRSAQETSDPLVEKIEQNLRTARRVATGLGALHASTKEAYAEYDEKTRRFLQEQEEMRTRIIDESQAIITSLLDIEVAFEEDGRFKFTRPIVPDELVDMYRPKAPIRQYRRQVQPLGPPTISPSAIASGSNVNRGKRPAPPDSPYPSTDEEGQPKDKGKSRAIPSEGAASNEANPFWRLPGENDNDYRRRVTQVHERMDREEQLAAEQLQQQREEAAEAHRRAQSELEAHRIARQQAEHEPSEPNTGDEAPLRPDPPRRMGEPEEEYRIRVRNFRRINGPAPPANPTPFRPPIQTPSTRRDEVRFAEYPRYEDMDVGPSISARVPNRAASAYADTDYIPPSSYAAARTHAARTNGDDVSHLSVARPRAWDHQDHELQLIVEMIHHHLDNEVANSAGVAFAKNLKIEVAQYSGVDDPEVFHTFMMKFIRQLRMYKLGGMSEEMEQERILALGQVLKGTAQTWFNQEYDSIRGYTRHRTFEGMVCALYRRFIHTSSARVANEQYDNCKWSPKDTVGGFYDRLLTAAERLRSMPDAYSLKCKFFYQLPTKIRRQAILQHRVTPEDSLMEELLDAAKWCERGFALAANFEGEEERKVKTKSSPLKIVSRENNPGTSRNSASRPVTRSTNPNASSGPVRPQRNNPRNKNSRDNNPRRNEATPRPSTSRPQREQTTRSNDPNACYNCGKTGHWSKDCPQNDDKDKQRDGSNKKRRLYAQRPVDDRSEDGQENDAQNEEQGGNGTPEDPQQENPRLGEYSDSEDGVRYYSEQSGDDSSPVEEASDDESDSEEGRARVGAMRLRGGCGEEEEADASDSAITVPLSDDEEEEEEVLRTIGQSMRLRVVGHSANNDRGEGNAESVGYSDDEEDDTANGNVTLDSELEVEDALRAEDDDEEPVHRHHPLVEGMPDQSGSQQYYASSTESVSSHKGHPGNMPTMGEAYTLGWQSALRMALTVLEAHKSELPDQDGMGMLIREGITRSITDVNNLLTDEPPVVKLPPPLPIVDKLDDRSYKVADLVIRERRRLKKRRHRSNRNERLRTAEGLLAEVAAEVAAANSEPEEEPAVTIRAMKPLRERTNKEEYRPTWVYDAKIVKGGKQPVRGKKDAIVLAVELNIAGLKCYTLFDSGSTTNAISPDVAVVSRTPLVELDEPMTLQLGTVGSKSTINYGTHAVAKMGDSSFESYYDVANIDYYDAILGTPFLLQHRVILDFGRRAVQIDGKTYQALTLEQEKLVRRQRRTFRRQVDDAVLYAKDQPPAGRLHSMSKKVNQPSGHRSINETLASDVAAPPTVPPPSTSPPRHRVFGNRNVTVEEVTEED